MATYKNMASCNFYLNTWRQIKFQRNCSGKKKLNYLTVGRAMSGLNVDEPKLSSMLTLRAELKERKCEIRWFKLCSSKLTITSVTRCDLSVVPPERLVFKTGQWKIKQTRCSMHGNLSPKVTRSCDLATSTDYAKFFSSYHWC